MHINKWIYIIIAIGVSACAMGQPEGCTDPNALNFDAVAEINDGSCLYPITSYVPEKISNLPNEVNETSGLIKLANGLWTHNDSGNTPKLFLLDTTTFQVIRSVTITSHTNIDWEELTHNDTHVFIGDFGNNNGARTDLRVLRFPTALLLDPAVETIEADEINFSYPDQTSFQSSSEHSFDCEAFIFFNDSLQLFTKHWGNEYTKHYTLPAEPGNYTAILKDSLLVEGQITAADIQGDSLIALLGYRPASFFEPFLFLLWDFQGDDFFSGNKRRINLGTVLDMGQNEAIYFTDDYVGYITSEKINQLNKEAAIYAFGIAHLFENTLELIASSNDNYSPITVYPNPSKGKLTIESSSLLIKEAFLLDAQGKIVYHRAFGSKGTHEGLLKIQKIPVGTYFLQVKFVEGDMVVKRVVME
jgi:hypothetical protein